MKTEPTGSSETLVMVYQTAQHHIQEDHNLQVKTINVPWELLGLFPDGEI
jgi:hypothetical protein